MSPPSPSSKAIHPLIISNNPALQIEKLKKIKNSGKLQRTEKCDEYHVISSVLNIIGSVQKVSQSIAVPKARKIYLKFFQRKNDSIDTFTLRKFDVLEDPKKCGYIDIHAEIQYVNNEKLLLKAFEVTISGKNIDQLCRQLQL